MTGPSPTREQLSLPAVLEALANPLRLRLVAQLADAPTAHYICGELLPEVPKSTASHHWRTLREAGVVEPVRDGRQLRPVLRRDDLDARFPGLLDAVLANLDRTETPDGSTTAATPA